MVGGCFIGKGFWFGNVDLGICILVYIFIVNMIYLNIFLIYLNFLVGGGGGLSLDFLYFFLICVFNVYWYFFFFFLGKLFILFF